MRFFSLIILLLIALIGASFAIINAAPVTVNYYVGHSTMPLSILILLMFSAGVAIGVISMMARLFKMKRELWHAKAKLKAVGASNDDKAKSEPRQVVKGDRVTEHRIDEPAPTTE